MIDHFKEAGRVPRFHGNGFTQLYLNENHRLHVWHPLLPMPEENNATIHDHIWALRSQVLLGQLGHNTYETDPSVSQMDMYQINQPAVRKNKADVFGFLDTVGVTLTGSYLMAPGTVYTMPVGKFHESANPTNSLIASLIYKGPDRIDSPRLLCPSGEVPFQAFGEGVSPPEADLWEAIKEALEALPPEIANHLVKMSPIVANDNGD